MGRASPFVVELSEAEREELEARVRRHRAEQRVALRARMILMAATGEENVAIARILRVAPNTVLKWRKRFCCERLAGLADRPRSGRPPLFAPEVLAHVNAVACERPAARDVPLARYSAADIAAQAVAGPCSSCRWCSC